MIRWLLIFCGFLVAGAGLYQLMEKGSGYLLLVWGNTSVETSLWFALISLIIVLLLIWLIVKLLLGGFRGALATKRKLFGYGDEQAQRKTVDGLIDFIEGNWSLAHKKLTRSANKVKAPVINYLAAARSAYEMGDEEEALTLLHKAENSDSKGRLVAAITQARMHFGNKEYEQALATLERATSLQPEHPVVLALRQQVYVALKDWASLKALLPILKKHQIGSMQERQQLELQLYEAQLQELISKHPVQNNAEKVAQLKQFWDNLPRHIQAQQTLLTTYTSKLMAMGEHDIAEATLSKYIPEHWYGPWLDLYGLLLCKESKKTLQTAEKWLSKQPKNPQLLLALSRLCLQNQQWGRAVDYLEESLTLDARAETYAELARVCEHLGNTEQSHHYYQQGLLAATHTLAVNEALS